MIESFCVLLLIISGVCWKCRYVMKYAAAVACLGFSLALAGKCVECVKVPWLWPLSFEWSNLYCFISSIVCFILFILHLTSRIFERVELKLGLLNIFAAVVCLCLAAKDLLTFFICVEVMNWLSVAFVWMERAERETVKVFIFNTLASLLLFFGILLEEGSVIAVAFLCKGAQFPFSSWLLAATKAHSLASVFIHCVSIVGVGVIGLQKFDVIDGRTFEMVRDIGLISAFLLPIVALFKTNIKEIIACLTISSVGLMFMNCGIKCANDGLLYFVFHALYKTILFLYYIYMSERCGSKDISELKSGSWELGLFATLSASGFPGFIGFFGDLLVSDNFESEWLKYSVGAVNLANASIVWKLFWCTSLLKSQRLAHVWPLWMLGVAGSLACCVIMGFEWDAQVALEQIVLNI